MACVSILTLAALVAPGTAVATAQEATPPTTRIQPIRPRVATPTPVDTSATAEPRTAAPQRPRLNRELRSVLTTVRECVPSTQLTLEGEVWPIPEGGAEIRLETDRISEAGQRIEGQAKVNLGMLLDEAFDGIEPFFVVLVIDTPKVATFIDGKAVLEHTVRRDLIAEDGTYVFDFPILGLAPGVVQIRAMWKWKILSEGTCALAINGVYIGCKLGGQLNSTCVCNSLNGLVPPGSWGCRLHPLTFRAVWKLWSCAATLGPSPY
jgi:hypothetical protein